MTRESLKEYFLSIKPDRWDCDILAELTDHIFDHFENRSCESCKWYEEYPSVCCNADCPLCADVVPSDYGCKYWEAKDVNQNTK